MKGEISILFQNKSNRVIESKNGKFLANQKNAIFLNKPMENAFVIARQYKMAYSEQTFTAVVISNLLEVQKKTKKANVFICIFQLYCKFEIFQFKKKSVF